MNNKGPVAKKPTELGARVVSALILISIALTLTWAGGNAFAVMCAIGGALILYEYFSIVGPVVDGRLRFAAYLGYGIALACWFVEGGQLGVAVALASAGAIAMAESLRKKTAWTAIGLLYAAIPFFALVLLRGSESTALITLLILFACVWGADTAAYFVGRRVGGPKLAPVISPKKTWSGFVGGLAGGVVAAMAVAYIFSRGAGWPGAIIAMALSFAAAIGDLLESWIKRRFGRKDSGVLIPGHGGVLDRTDGLIVAAVLAWALGAFWSGAAFEAGKPGEAFAEVFLLP